MKNSRFYANIIIYLTIWLLFVPFCHFEVKISIIRLEVLLYVYKAHISYYHPKKEKQSTWAIRVILLTHTFVLLIHETKSLVLSYVEYNAMIQYIFCGNNPNKFY